MPEVILRKGIFGSYLYIKSIGKIKLTDMSLDNSKEDMGIVDALCSKKDLDFPFQKNKL